MDFTEIQRKLSCQNETIGKSEFSLSQVLSLPLEFLVYVVKNRREADLLLKVSESSSSLDLLTQTYEMFASKAQALQEAWDGLWLAQEPYLVPAIPLVGLEMSGVNSGRSILLEKLDNEFRTLKELGKQLCHYIDVNQSLVEELRMEGIERLAVNKLLLVDVEKELVRRITHICDNKSVRDLSSMRQFVCQLRKPTSTSMKVALDDYGNSTMNGSCSTEKITTDGSSDAQQRSLDIMSGDRDIISPDSQSFASKCVNTQGDNMHPPSITTPISELPDIIVTSGKGFPLGTGVLAGAGDIKPDVRNQSSSASEERLPKAAPSSHDKLLDTTTDNNTENRSHEKLPVDITKQPDINGNGTLLFREFNTDFLRSSKEGEQGKSDLEGSSDPDLLVSHLDDKMVTTSGHAVFRSFDPDQVNKTFSRILPSTQPDTKGSKRKRQVEAVSSGESADLIARECKRITVQTSSESLRATMHTSTGTFMTKRRFLHSIEESSHSLFCIGLNDKDEERVNTTTDLCLPCSCDLPNIENVVHPKPSMHGRCRQCGCCLSKQTACEQETHIEQGQVCRSYWALLFWVVMGGFPRCWEAWLLDPGNRKMGRTLLKAWGGTINEISYEPYYDASN